MKIILFHKCLLWVSLVSAFHQSHALSHRRTSHLTTTPLMPTTKLWSVEPKVTPDIVVHHNDSTQRWNRRKQIAKGLIGSLGVMSVAAKAGLLGAYPNDQITNDVFWAGLTSVLAVGLNRSITWGCQAKVYGPKIGRKLTHLLAAPLFMVTWPFFSNGRGSRCFAGLVTLINLYRLYLAGTGDPLESSLAKTISRSGDQSEVLGGPFVYVCIFQVMLLAFWRNRFEGVVAMGILAAGDGMADILGRTFGHLGPKWFFSPDKTLVGSLAFWAFASFVTCGLVLWWISMGSLSTTLSTGELISTIVGISGICSLVEVLPWGDDNYTVPGTAALLASWWLH